MQQLIFTFSVLLAGLTSGYFLKILYDKQCIRLPLGIDGFRLTLQYVGLIGFISGAISLALWVVTLPDMRLMTMPFLCLFAVCLGGGLAKRCARDVLHLSPRQIGAMYCCGSFSNIGAIGALVCYVFIGEAGFALVPVYKLFEELFYFTVGFSTAKSFGTKEVTRTHFITRLRRMLCDPLISCILVAILFGLGLNIMNVPRPIWCGTLTSFMVPVGTFLLLTSIGLTMHFPSVREYLREGVCIVVIKSIIVPVIITGLAYVLGFSQIMEGVPLKVILICSSMPVAFVAVVPPSLYDLDLDLANSCWLVSTGALVVVLPVLYVLLLII